MSKGKKRSGARPGRPQPLRGTKGKRKGESSSVPTTLPTAYDVYPLDGRHDGGYYTVKDCVTIDVLPRTPGNNVYVGFMVWSNFTATKCRGLVSLNQVIK